MSKQTEIRKGKKSPPSFNTRCKTDDILKYESPTPNVALPSTSEDYSVKFEENKVVNTGGENNSSVKSLEWVNLTYTVVDKGKKSWFKKCLASFQSLYLDPNKVSSDNESRKNLEACSSHLLHGKRRILNKLNGYIQDSSLMAILGPSGSGKSTLLSSLFCSVGRGTGMKGVLEGDVLLHGHQGSNSTDNISFISQEDYLFDKLTVRETLCFACTVRCPFLNKKQVSDKVNEVLTQLWLEVCSDTLVQSCSGGQKKRLSIGSELICSPRIMILDEPTSGLDSSTALHCIQLLKALTRSQRMSILLTIHQPSSRVLDSFDNIYFLSKFGYNIYFGPPEELVSYLNSHNLTCPKFHNPADFMMEVASSCHINESSPLLDSRRPTLASLKLISVKTKDKGKDDANKNSNEATRHGSNFCHNLKHILSRQMKIILREPLLTSVRFFAHIIVGVSVSLLYGSEAGSSSGCNSLTRYGQPALLDQHRVVYTNENMTLLFFSLFFLTFTSLTPTILTFPSELKIFIKEHNNQYYSTLVYFIATTIVDLPFQLIFPLIFVVIVYPLTGQPMDSIRFSLFGLISCLVSLVSQSVGLFISTLFTDSMKVVVFLAPVSLTPIFLFSGFFVRFSLCPSYLKPLYYASYIKHSFEGYIQTVYGFGRCKSIDPYSFISQPLLSQSHSSENRSIFVGDGSQIDGEIEEEEDGGYIPPLVVDQSQYIPDNQTVWTTDIMDANETEELEGHHVLSESVTEFVTTTLSSQDPNVLPMRTSAQFSGLQSQFYSYVLQEFGLDEDESGSEVLYSCIILTSIVLLLRFMSCLLLVFKTKHIPKK